MKMMLNYAAQEKVVSVLALCASTAAALLGYLSFTIISDSLRKPGIFDIH